MTQPLNYQTALAYVSKAKDIEEGRPYGKNTRILYDVDDGMPFVRIQYHATTIVEYYHDHTRYYNGGWHSVTTKDRLNKLLPKHMRLSQKNFVWYLHINKSVHELPDDFTITISSDGDVDIE
jgi:hypothetical protein